MQFQPKFGASNLFMELRHWSVVWGVDSSKTLRYCAWGPSSNADTPIQPLESLASLHLRLLKPQEAKLHVATCRGPYILFIQASDVRRQGRPSLKPCWTRSRWLCALPRTRSSKLSRSQLSHRHKKNEECTKVLSRPQTPACTMDSGQVFPAMTVEVRVLKQQGPISRAHAHAHAHTYRNAY